jgi:hypothetical protein
MLLVHAYYLGGKIIHSRLSSSDQWSPQARNPSKKEFFVVYVRQTQYMLVGQVLPQLSAPQKPLVVTQEDYPELRPILPQSSDWSTCSRL